MRYTLNLLKFKRLFVFSHFFRENMTAIALEILDKRILGDALQTMLANELTHQFQMSHRATAVLVLHHHPVELEIKSSVKPTLYQTDGTVRQVVVVEGILPAVVIALPAGRKQNAQIASCWRLVAIRALRHLFPYQVVEVGSVRNSYCTVLPATTVEISTVLCQIGLDKNDCRANLRGIFSDVHWDAYFLRLIVIQSYKQTLVFRGYRCKDMKNN